MVTCRKSEVVIYIQNKVLLVIEIYVIYLEVNPVLEKFKNKYNWSRTPENK